MVSSLRRAAFTVALLRRPRVFREYVGWYVADRVPRGASHRRKSGMRPISLADAMARLPRPSDAGAPPGRAMAALQERLPAVTELSANLSPNNAVLAGDNSLGELLYVLVRAVQPELVDRKSTRLNSSH